MSIFKSNNRPQWVHIVTVHDYYDNDDYCLYSIRWLYKHYNIETNFHVFRPFDVRNILWGAGPWRQRNEISVTGQFLLT